MNNSDTILVVIDPTVKQQYALKQATNLASSLGKNLELFISTHDESLKHYQSILGHDVITSSAKFSIDQLMTRLDAMAEPLRAQGLDVCCDVTWDRPLYEGIIRKAIKSTPFMIIKDTHYHPKLTRSIFQNTDWSLIRLCPFPVLFVKHHEPWTAPAILSAVNPINDSEKELDTALIRFGELISDKMDGQHAVLHVFEPLSLANIGITGYPSSLGSFNDEMLIMHRNRVNNLVDAEKVGHEKIILEQGDVRQVLPEVVRDKKIDLLVMGAISRSRLEQVFIGGTTEAVLDELDSDILVLKPASFKTTVSATAPPEYPQVVWPI